MTPYYSDGSVTIYHGDCRDLLPRLPRPDMLIADPPYGISLRTDYEATYGKPKAISAKRHNHAPVYGDDEPFDPSHLLGFPNLFLFGANYYRDRLPNEGGWLLWDKVCSNEVKRLASWSDGEMAWTNCFRGVRIFRHAWNGFSRSSENSYHVHPTQKPVVLMRWIIDRYGPDADLIIDPYMGSGPTLRAAKDCGRKAIGIEYEEQYCEIAAKRMGQEVLAL